MGIITKLAERGLLICNYTHQSEEQKMTRKLSDIIHVSNYIPRPSDIEKMPILFGVVCLTDTKNMEQVEKVVINIIRAGFKGFKIPTNPSDEFVQWYNSEFGLQNIQVTPIQIPGQDLIYSRGFNYLYHDLKFGPVLRSKSVLFAGKPLIVDNPILHSPCQIDQWVLEKFNVDLELDKFNPPQEFFIPALTATTRPPIPAAPVPTA